jgi:hypothetical protein
MKKQIASIVFAALFLFGACLVTVSCFTGCVVPVNPGGTPTTQPSVTQSFGNALLVSQVKLLITDAQLWLPAEDQPYIMDAAQALANLQGAGPNATAAQQQALVDALSDAENRLILQLAKAKTGK